MYRIELTPKARRGLKKLPDEARRRLQPHLDALASSPRPRGVVKLAGVEDLWRLRVGSYRIVFQIHDDVLLVLVVKIAARKEVYR